MSARSSQTIETLDYSKKNLTELPVPNKPSNVINLNISFNMIKTLPNLNMFTNLRYINVSHNKFTNLMPLAALTQIVELNCSFNNINSIDFVQPMSKLRVLNASHNNVSLIKAYIPQSIQSLDLSENQISSLKFLENMTLENLEYLNIESPSMNNLMEVKSLLQIPNLKIVDIGFYERKGDARLLEFMKFIKHSLVEFDSQKLNKVVKIDFNADEVIDILATGSEKNLIDFLNQQVIPIEWNKPIFLEYDETNGMTEQEMHQKLDYIEEILNQSNDDSLDLKIEALERKIKQTFPEEERNLTDPLALIISPNDTEEIQCSQIEREINVIKKELSTITSLLAVHDKALEKIWNSRFK